MKLVRQFTGKDSVIDLVKEDYNILPILRDRKSVV